MAHTGNRYNALRIPRLRSVTPFMHKKSSGVERNYLRRSSRLSKRPTRPLGVKCLNEVRFEDDGAYLDQLQARSEQNDESASEEEVRPQRRRTQRVQQARKSEVASEAVSAMGASVSCLEVLTVEQEDEDTDSSDSEDDFIPHERPIHPACLSGFARPIPSLFDLYSTRGPAKHPWARKQAKKSASKQTQASQAAAAQRRLAQKRNDKELRFSTKVKNGRTFVTDESADKYKSFQSKFEDRGYLMMYMCLWHDMENPRGPSMKQYLANRKAARALELENAEWQRIGAEVRAEMEAN